jgi:hypothetical protein
MPYSVMLCRVALVKTDASEEHLLLQEPQGVTFQKTAFFKIGINFHFDNCRFKLKQGVLISINLKLDTVRKVDITRKFT